MPAEPIRKGVHHLIQPVARIFRVLLNRDPNPDEQRQKRFNTWKWFMGLGKKTTAQAQFPTRVVIRPPQGKAGEKAEQPLRPADVYPRKAKAALAAKATEIIRRDERAKR